jgi:hypothetical protein
MPLLFILGFARLHVPLLISFSTIDMIPLSPEGYVLRLIPSSAGVCLDTRWTVVPSSNVLSLGLYHSPETVSRSTMRMA